MDVKTTITVEGSAKGTIKSDLMKIGFVVDSYDTDAEKVIGLNKNFVLNVTSELGKIGVAEDKIKNLGFLIDIMLDKKDDKDDKDDEKKEEVKIDEVKTTEVPKVEEIKPVNGETPKVNGEKPKVNGETPKLNGETPKLNGETPKVNGETPPKTEGEVVVVPVPEVKPEGETEVTKVPEGTEVDKSNLKSKRFKFIGLTTFEITLDDLAVFAKVLNYLKDNDVKIKYIDFTSSSDALFYLSDSLTNDAMDNALEKAKNSVDQKGYSIGRIVNVNVSENDEEKDILKNGVKIEKVNIIEVTVKVTYELVKDDKVVLKSHKKDYKVNKLD
jgi:uncharacterized protein YggE